MKITDNRKPVKQHVNCAGDVLRVGYAYYLLAQVNGPKGTAEYNAIGLHNGNRYTSNKPSMTDLVSYIINNSGCVDNWEIIPNRNIEIVFHSGDDC